MSDEELRQLALAATPGPWENSYVDQHRVQCRGAGDEIVDTRYASEKPPAERKANALFIAAANPTAVLALLDENVRLREALTWFVENDDTNEGDTPMPEHGGRSWNEINAYWIEGLNTARAALEVKP
jgi:hypothetical protein